MPSQLFRNLSDEDLRGIIAYLRSQPPVEPDTPPNNLNIIGAILVNIAPIIEAQAPVTEPVISPPRGVTAAYGKYLTSYTCGFCHGDDLQGDAAFEAPGLVVAGRAWTAEQFISFMRSGVKPDGSSVDSVIMPWEDLSEHFREDDDLRAIHAHLGTLGG